MCPILIVLIVNNLGIIHYKTWGDNTNTLSALTCDSNNNNLLSIRYMIVGHLCLILYWNNSFSVISTTFHFDTIPSWAMNWGWGYGGQIPPQKLKILSQKMQRSGGPSQTNQFTAREILWFLEHQHFKTMREWLIGLFYYW